MPIVYTVARCTQAAALLQGLDWERKPGGMEVTWTVTVLLWVESGQNQDR